MQGRHFSVQEHRSDFSTILVEEFLSLSKVQLTRKKSDLYDCKFFPNSGEVPSVAEKNFLAKVRGLDMYGVDPHPCKVRAFRFQEII